PRLARARPQPSGAGPSRRADPSAACSALRGRQPGARAARLPHRGWLRDRERQAPQVGDRRTTHRPQAREPAHVTASIPSPPANGIHLGPFFLHAYGLAYVAAVLAAVAITSRRWQRQGGDGALVREVALWGFPSGPLV